MKHLTWLLGLACCLPLSALALEKPKVPLSSTGRWIVDTAGKRVKLRCVTWAGHLETNIPEGLHKQPLDYIAWWIAYEGFNCVRLTYSIEMALDHQARKVSEAFVAASGATGVPVKNLTDLYELAVVKNPWIKDAKVMDVFDAVQKSLWDNGVMTLLDNHVSKANWCCSLSDGNGWWKDTPGYAPSNSQFFDTPKWLDGLVAMAQWSLDRPGVIGMSLRNELRASILQSPESGPVWLEHMSQAAQLVHLHNPNVLIIVGGINGGTDLTPLRTVGRGMDTGVWADKNVWEVHSYSFTGTTPSFGNCDVKKAQYGGLFGFVLDQGQDYTGPLFLSEFGVNMTGGSNDGLTDDDYEYLTCLVGYMEGNDADWSLWAVQGSYYVRDSTVDKEEPWGALDYTWRYWRNPDFMPLLGQMANVTQGPGI